jgi:uncharacterized lipoprotein YmbA
MRNSTVRIASVLLSTLITLAGCAGKIRYPSYYLLNLPAPVTVADQSRPLFGSVAVREFNAPRFLREGPIAYRESDVRLGFYNLHRWAVDPRRSVTTAVIQQIRSRGMFRSVELFDGRGTPDCLMTGSIDHLEEVDQESSVSIEVSLSARLINLQTGEVLWHGASSKTAKLDQRSVPGIVTGMSQEVGNTVEGLIASMQDHVARTPGGSSENN